MLLDSSAVLEVLCSLLGYPFCTYSLRQMCFITSPFFFNIFFSNFSFLFYFVHCGVIIEVWKWRKQLLSQKGKCLWSTNGKTLKTFQVWTAIQKGYKASEMVWYTKVFLRCFSTQSQKDEIRWPSSLWTKSFFQEEQISIKTAAYPTLDDDTSLSMPICKERKTK